MMFNPANFYVANGKVYRVDDDSEVSKKRLNNRKQNMQERIDQLNAQINTLQAEKQEWVDAKAAVQALVDQIL